EARPESPAAVGDRRDHDGDLQRRDVNVALTDAKIGRVPVKPGAAPIVLLPLPGRKCARRVLARGNAGALAEVEAFAQIENAVHARFQSIGDEIGVARLDQSPLKVVLTGRSEVLDLVSAQENVAVPGFGR